VSRRSRHGNSAASPSRSPGRPQRSRLPSPAPDTPRSPRALGRRLAAALGTLATLTFLLSCADSAHETSASYGANEAVAKLAWSTDVGSLDFARAGDVPSRTLHELISEPLVYYDKNLEIVPAAAATWEVSADALTIRFTLRGDLRWHDGRSVSSRDVVHTWRIMTDPASGAPDRAANFSSVVSVEADGPSSVVVRYRSPQPSAFDTWATAPLLPAHVPIGTSSLPVGCGPWILEEWSPGQRIVLRANPDHPYAAPRLSKLMIEVISEPATSFAALRSGDVDIAPLYPHMWQSVRDDSGFRDSFEVQPWAPLHYFYIAWHIDESRPLFVDARVRRALTHAIDRQAYLDSFGGPDDRVGVTSFHPDIWPHRKEIPPWPHDPAEARRLLQESGWIDSDEDGVRDHDGRSLEFDLTYPSGNAQTERIALFVRSELSKVGIDARLAATEWSVMQQRIRSRDYSAVMLGLRLDPDPDPFNIWHSTQASIGLNYAELRDSEVDRLIDEARRTFDRPLRERLYTQMEERLHRLEPATVLFYPSSRLAASKTLAGVEVGPRGATRWRPGPSAWHREDSLQGAP